MRPRRSFFGIVNSPSNCLGALLMPLAHVVFVSSLFAQPQDREPNQFESWNGTWVRSDPQIGYCISTNPDLIGVAFLWQPPETQEMTGLVVDESQNPVPDVDLLFSVNCHGVPIREQTKSNADGKFLIKLPVDPDGDTFSWAVWASKNELAARMENVSATKQQTLVMKREGQVSIRLHEAESGKRIEDFHILYRGSRLYKSVDGVCRIDGVVPNSSSFISPIANGVACTRFNIDLSGKLKTELDIAVDKGEIVRGTTSDSFGRAASFRPVLLMNTLSSRTMTNGDGQFAIFGVPLGRPVKVGVSTQYQSDSNIWHLEVQTVQYDNPPTPPLEFDVPADLYTRPTGNARPGFANPGVERKGVIAGCVKFPNGTPCRQFSIRLRRSKIAEMNLSEINYLYEETGSGVLFGNEEGRFVLGYLDPGKAVDVIVSADGFADTVIENVEAATVDSMLDEALDIKLAEASSVDFRFSDANDLPVAEATVYVCRGGEKTFRDLDRFTISSKGETNQKGVVTFAKLPFEQGILVVTPKGGLRQYFDFSPELTEFVVEQPIEVTLKFLIEDSAKFPIRISLRLPDHFNGEEDYHKILTENDREWKLPLRNKSYRLRATQKQKGKLPGDETAVTNLLFDNGQVEETLDLRSEWELVLSYEFELKQND